MRISAHRRVARLSHVGLTMSIAIALLGRPMRASAADANAPLADNVPADAVVYVGWRGATGLEKGYAATHLQAVIDATDFKQLADPFLPRLLERVERENKEAADVIRAVVDVAGPLWRRPTAFVFGGGELKGNAPPVPRVALLCRAGPYAGALHQQLERAVDQIMKQQPLPESARPRVERMGDLVAVLVGYDKKSLPGFGPAAGGSLAGNDQFKSALGHFPSDAALIGYVDFTRAFDEVGAAINQFAPEQPKQAWPKVRDASGLKSVRYLVWGSGFDGKDWVDEAFIDAPAPRSGLLRLMDGAPLSDESLKLVPQTALLAGAGQFDTGKLIDTLRAIAIEVSPDAGPGIDSGLEQVNQMVGFDVRNDLVKSLGDEWVWYADPYTGGRNAAGGVVINRLKDAEKAEKSLTRLETLANAVIAQQIPKGQVTVKFEVTESRGVKIHYLDVPLLSPAWAVHDGNLYVALFPQVVASAATGGGHSGKSILDNPGFVALRKRLGVAKTTSIQFMDLQRTAPDAYSSWLMVSRLSGVADLFGVKSPAMLAPPLDRLVAELGPTGSVTWVDDQGWHARSVCPFPGAEVLANDPLSSLTSIDPMLVSILLPSLNRAREQANRVKSANNLRQIGFAALMYSNEKHKMPDNQGELLKGYDLTIDVFLSPRTTTVRPSLADPEKQAEWVNQNSDYVWVGKGVKVDADAETILAYEKPDGVQEGIEILFADGHVEYFPMEEAKKRIDVATGQKRGDVTPKP